MTVLHPCHNCHRKADCHVRAKTLAGLKGHSITKATLKCRIPEQDFPPGAVVIVEAFEVDEEFENKHTITRRGVVRGWRNRRATIVLDKDQEIQKLDDGAIGYLTVASERLTPTELPPVELCRCGLSQARCEANDYPSVRNGTWSCQEEIQEREEAERAARGYW